MRLEVLNGYKKIRNNLGLSQSQFAKKFNIPLGTLAHWEQGVRTPLQYVISMIKQIINLEKEQTNG